jgi:hypothetical protein
MLDELTSLAGDEAKIHPTNSLRRPASTQRIGETRPLMSARWPRRANAIARHDAHSLDDTHPRAADMPQILPAIRQGRLLREESVRPYRS